jgi:hypothetical protein
MSSDLQYHLRRARVERDIAYRAGDPRVSDAHMRLSALHLQRALLLQEVQRAPVGNVSPLKGIEGDRAGSPISEISARFIELHG